MWSGSPIWPVSGICGETEMGQIVGGSPGPDQGEELSGGITGLRRGGRAGGDQL